MSIIIFKSRFGRLSLLLCLIVLLFAIVAAGAIRWLGESRFAVVPEKEVQPDVPQSSELKRQSIALVRRHDPAQSLVLPIAGGHAAFKSRIELIELAERTIDVQYYTLDDSDVGRALLVALGEAAERGVVVRVLLDDIGLVGREAMLARFAADHDALQLRVFNPTWLRTLRPFEYIVRFPRANRRMHNKSLTVDGAATIVGGRNIGESYFGEDESMNFSDLDVLAVGEVAGNTRSAFNRYWRSGIAFDITRVRGAETALAADEYHQWLLSGSMALQEWRTTSVSDDSNADSPLRNIKVSAIPSTIRTIADPPDKVIGKLDAVDGTVAPEVLEMLSNAKREVLIASPYLIPGEAGMAVFRELRKRGVEVAILTNSLAANDVAAVHVGYRDYREPLLELGITLHEFKPQARSDSAWRYRDSLLGRTKAALHTKAFVIDQRISFIGSFNLDPRSAMHNTEMGFVIDSVAFAHELHANLSRSLEERAWSVMLTPSGTLEWHDRSNGGDQLVTETEPATVLPQRLLVRLASWLPIDWML